LLALLAISTRQHFAASFARTRNENVNKKNLQKDFDLKSNQIKSNQIKSNQIKSNQIKSNVCLFVTMRPAGTRVFANYVCTV
jgi:hypothetical protein